MNRLKIKEIIFLLEENPEGGYNVNKLYSFTFCFLINYIVTIIKKEKAKTEYKT
jgi:hypothetical protein